jgi:hypothetical protein
MSEARLVQSGAVSVAEAIPANLRFLDDYQANAWQQIQWDDDSQTRIQGQPTRERLLNGLVEEIGELTDQDRIEPAYNRLGALLWIGTDPSLQPGKETPTAVARHLKEFGDVSWYLATYLHTYDIAMSKVAVAGLVANQLWRISQSRADETQAVYLERHFPWAGLLSASSELVNAANRCQELRRDERIYAEHQLIVAAGKMTVAMMHVVANRFDTTYEAVLAGNKAKLDRRIANGTVFDKSGGDDR